MKHKSLYKLFLILLVFTFSNILFADEFTLIEKTVESAYYKNIDIKTYSGSVTIKTWDKLAVNVAIRGNQDALKNVDYNIEIKDGNVSVTTSAKDEMLKTNLDLKIEVLVPRYFNPTVKTNGGEIKIVNLAGNVKLETTANDIYVYELTGESDLKTTGGNIKMTSFKGNVKANTTGGNINIEGSEGVINAETSGGDIKVKYTGSNMGMTLKNTGGDIKIILPETFKAMLDASATAGEIKTDFSVLVNKDYSGQTLNGIINGGGEIIKCSTTGGKISILK
jgi:hypothetical protein